MSKVRVSYQGPTNKPPGFKKKEFYAAPEWAYRDENGVEKKLVFVNNVGEPISLVIGKDFSFNLDSPMDKRNYETLKKRVKYDSDFREHIVIEDDNLDIDEKIDTVEYKIEVVNKVVKLKENNDFKTLSHIHRRLIGSVVGKTDKVVYNNVLTITQQTPNDVDKIINDADYEYNELIAKSVELGKLEKNGETYTDKFGSIIATSTADMVFYLKNNKDFKDNLAALMTEGSKPLSSQALNKAKSEIVLDEMPVLVEEEPELFDDKVEAAEMSEDDIRAMVDKAVDLGVMITRNNQWYKVENVQKQYHLKDLYDFYITNRVQVNILKRILDTHK